MTCFNLDKHLNNEWVYSMVVRRENRGLAVGYWQGITATESQDYNLYVGTAFNDSYNKQADWNSMTKASYELGLALENGFTFDSHATGEVLISDDYYSTLKHDVQSTYGLVNGIENRTTCTTSGNDGAGLWQWVVASSDGTATSFSTHTVCRKGELAFAEPKCPYFACLNADCSECSSDWMATF